MTLALLDWAKLSRTEQRSALRRPAQAGADALHQRVSEIINDVRARGDEATDARRRGKRGQEELDRHGRLVGLRPSAGAGAGAASPASAHAGAYPTTTAGAGAC